MGFDVTGDWAPAWTSEYFGETKHDQDDLPGTSASKTNFDHMIYVTQSGGYNFWSSLGNSNAPGLPSRYIRETYAPSVGGIGMRLWTQ